ncbi:MAG: OmpH family outer membrane protein [Bacteroidales bacterium]|nr:OmpH family outer membrane protein [Bacteroidales bacterium]
MKKTNLIISIIAIIGFIGLSVIEITKKEKVVYIDNNVIIQKYKGMKNARAEFEKKASVWEANADTLIKEWEQELKNYEKERSKMTTKEKELKEELLRNKQQQIQGYSQAMQKKAADEEQKMTQTVVNEINDYLTEYGKKHNYKFILGATGAGNILYADENFNITEKILEGLNAEYEKQ